MTFPFLEEVPLGPLKPGPPTSEVISPVLLSGQFRLHIGRQEALSGQHEAFSDRQNNLWGSLKPIQGPPRPTGNLSEHHSPSHTDRLLSRAETGPT